MWKLSLELETKRGISIINKNYKSERSLMSPSAGIKHTYVRLATFIHWQILHHKARLPPRIASGTSNAMFDELAERSLMSPLAGMKHTYVRLATFIHW